MTYNLHASNGQQESAGQGGDYVSAEEHRALIDRAERSHAAGAGQMSDEGFLQRRIEAQAARIEWLERRLRETAGEAVAAYTRIEALETVLMMIAAIDPEGQRADDLGRVTRIARAALAPEQDR